MNLIVIKYLVILSRLPAVGQGVQVTLAEAVFANGAEIFDQILRGFPPERETLL